MNNVARTFANVRAPLSRTPNIDEALIAAVYARVFGTDDGRVVLAHLRQLTKEMVVPPDATDSALRMKEGQRQLVDRIERIIESGERGK